MPHFWYRCSKEYLLELRSANFFTPVNCLIKFKIGDIVIIHADRMEKHLWKSKVINEIFFRRDTKKEVVCTTNIIWSS